MKNFCFSIIFLLSIHFVNAQEITMFSNFFGTSFYKDDTKIKLKEVNELLKTNPEASFHWKKSKTYGIMSGVTAAASITFAIIELTDNKPFENTDNNTLNLVGYFGSLGATLVFDLLSRSQAKKAVLAYNESLGKKTTFQLGPSKQGIGIALTF